MWDLKLFRLAGVAALFATSVLPCSGDVWDDERKIDFSKSHSLQLLEESELQFEENTLPSATRRSFSLSKQNLLIRLPAGRTIQQKIETGSVIAENGLLQSFSTTGQILPLEDAYKVAKQAHLAFAMPLDRLENWYHEASDPERRAASFGNVAPNHYPALHIQIHRSMNPRYPWFVRLSMGWISPRHKDWDEARAEDENASPPEVLAIVSLDSPSGKIYNAAEAFEHLNDAQKKLDKELGQVRDADGKLIESNQPHRAKDDQKTEDVAKTTDDVDKSRKWPLFAAILALVGALIVFSVNRRKTQ